jgi:hypothetical protein
MHTLLRTPHLIALAALGLGIAADLLFFQRLPGISFPIFVGLCLATLLFFSMVEDRPPTLFNLFLGAGACVFALLTVVRADITLVFLNLCICLGLLLLQVALFRERGFLHLGIFGVAIQTIVAAFGVLFRPGPFAWQVASDLMPRGERAALFAPIARGLAIAVPVVTIFTILLTAADAVFASIVGDLLALRLPFDLPDLGGHLFLIGFAAWIGAGGLLTGLRAITPGDPATAPEDSSATPTMSQGWLGCVEAVTLLICVDLLFFGFMAIQGAYLFGGLDTLSRTGMTYSEYARRGFFELVAVACLSLGLGWLLNSITRRNPGTWQPRVFLLACATLALLTFGLVASAVQRMWLYEIAYGFTHLRLYTHTFMGWLAILLILFVMALLRRQPHLFTVGGSVAALIVQATLTLVNPEAVIVQANVARYLATGEISLNDDTTIDRDAYALSESLDSYYLTQLSTDATPALVAVLPLLPAYEQEIIRAKLDKQQIWLEQTWAESGWPSWHLSRAQATAALAQR